MSSKLRRSLLIAAIVALLVVPFAAFTQAQDTPATTTCDSTLILLVLLAERDYGYVPTMDVSGFERGQFGSFFDEMMADMGDMSMATPDGSTSTDATADPAMATPDASMATVDPAMATPMDMTGTGVQLLPGNVAGEDPNCTALRSDVEAYLFSNLSMGGMDMGAGMSDSGVGSDMAGMAFSATLDGLQEVPGPGDEDGSGSALITLSPDTGEVCYDIQVSNITLPAAAAHIHVGSAGTAGDVVVPLDAPGADGLVSGCAAVDPAIIEALMADPSIYYVNVHTSDFPDGAVRGQLGGM